MEIFTLIKGNRIYYLGDKGNIKDKIGVFEFKRLPVLENCIISIHKIRKRKYLLQYTFPLDNNEFCYKYFYFRKIFDIIKFRKLSEELFFETFGIEENSADDDFYHDLPYKLYLMELNNNYPIIH